ncbi:tripartite tricarboxylate transporter TctB family protein [Aurantimonas manganoxydans]|uniref:tripartite tricarboxylate transporter TctB family protein n=1 Tax=Aurantimonas manganoxydans TaxID=651183 RepID=UPI0002E35772|nr:tripartite tricarboxylate transporter TctB family protein [Aurantimonas manganoxydans]
MIRSDRLLIAGTILGVCALVIWGMTIGDYPASANVFPAIAAGGVLLFGLMAMRGEPPNDDHAAITWSAILWLLAALPLIYLLGFRIGLPAYGFVYAIARRTGPFVALVVAIGIAAVIEILFVRVLSLSFHWGWLIAPLLR